MPKPLVSGLGRRSLIQRGLGAGAVIGASQLGAPFILSARGEVPIKVGMINPLTGTNTSATWSGQLIAGVPTFVP